MNGLLEMFYRNTQRISAFSADKKRVERSEQHLKQLAEKTSSTETTEITEKINNKNSAFLSVLSGQKKSRAQRNSIKTISGNKPHKK